jgi:hypothetical protein
MPKRLRKRESETNQLMLRIVKDSAVKADGAETLSIPAKSKYAPLSSVWELSDGELLEEIFRFYTTIPPEPYSIQPTTRADSGKVRNATSFRWTSTRNTSR